MGCYPLGWVRRSNLKQSLSDLRCEEPTTTSRPWTTPRTRPASTGRRTPPAAVVCRSLAWHLPWHWLRAKKVCLMSEVLPAALERDDASHMLRVLPGRGPGLVWPRGLRVPLRRHPPEPRRLGRGVGRRRRSSPAAEGAGAAGAAQRVPHGRRVPRARLPLAGALRGRRLRARTPPGAEPRQMLLMNSSIFWGQDMSGSVSCQERGGHHVRGLRGGRPAHQQHPGGGRHASPRARAAPSGAEAPGLRQRLPRISGQARSRAHGSGGRKELTHRSLGFSNWLPGKRSGNRGPHKINLVLPFGLLLAAIQHPTFEWGAPQFSLPFLEPCNKLQAACSRLQRATARSFLWFP